MSHETGRHGPMVSATRPIQKTEKRTAFAHLVPWRRISSSTVGRYSSSPQASSLSAVSSRAGVASCWRHLNSCALAGAPNREGSSGARRRASSVSLRLQIHKCRLHKAAQMIQRCPTCEYSQYHRNLNTSVDDRMQPWALCWSRSFAWCSSRGSDLTHLQPTADWTKTPISAWGQ